MGKKDKYNPDMVAEWLMALFPNPSGESPEGPKFESCLAINIYMVL